MNLGRKTFQLFRDPEDLFQGLLLELIPKDSNFESKSINTYRDLNFMKIQFTQLNVNFSTLMLCSMMNDPFI